MAVAQGIGGVASTSITSSIAAVLAAVSVLLKGMENGKRKAESCALVVGCSVQGVGTRYSRTRTRYSLLVTRRRALGTQSHVAPSAVGGRGVEGTVAVVLRFASRLVSSRSFVRDVATRDRAVGTPSEGVRRDATSSEAAGRGSGCCLLGRRLFLAHRTPVTAHNLLSNYDGYLYERT